MMCVSISMSEAFLFQFSSKQYTSGRDAAFCGVFSGGILFAYVPTK